ncbi:DUF2279 domain-containing protein [Flavobacterium pokkalii]|uniref:DUF2279 domain-containing protein n=1 Tax=Flavobacterium pokkalii TaxID=1940408 RepID=UPI001886C4B8|nr:DUF2279 domain-containing protein [Flavobacterium pokkalii]
MKYKGFLFVGCLLVVFNCTAQGKIDSFFKPSDTLNNKRKKAVFVSEAAFSAITLVGLNQLWYADYPRSKFHFINDNQEWLQMDKLGHLFSSYHLGRLGSEMLQWSGATPKKQLLYGAGLGFAFLTAVEVLDGFSSEWGASSGDVIANATGTALYVSQQLLWKEQRITPKFSFHNTRFANYRPEVLGASFSEQILKDYNGQTYWLSANLKSFFRDSKIPKILNIAVGYGADGMLTGKGENSPFLTEENLVKSRQFYLSLDVDLTKIDTKSHFLKTFFSVFSVLKIPAPTLEYSGREGLKAHLLYF